MSKPVRINKYLAERKLCSRREADRLIAEGLVMVNGASAHLGQMITIADKVEIKNTRKELEYYLFNKPIHVVTSLAQDGETEIRDLLPNNMRNLYPVGRLDKASHGLIILTNDGRLTEPLLGPQYYHEKEYEVEVDRRICARDLKTLSQGVELAPEGPKTRPCVIRRLGDCKFSITLTEGRNRQIRRMCGVLGCAVEDLKRVRIMHLRLGRLPSGHWRVLDVAEKKALLAKCGLN